MARLSVARGFTLVEMLVSLLILSSALLVALPIVSRGLVAATDSEDEMRAAMLLQSLLDRVNADIPLVAGQHQGRFGQRYAWNLSIEPYGTEVELTSWILDAYVVRAAVEWRRDMRRARVSAQTIRLASRLPR